MSYTVDEKVNSEMHYTRGRGRGGGVRTYMYMYLFGTNNHFELRRFE